MTQIAQHAPAPGTSDEPSDLGRQLDTLIARLAGTSDGALLTRVRARLAELEQPPQDQRRRNHGADPERLRQSVLDALPLSVAVLDPDGRITAVNRAWRSFAEENQAPAAVREGIGIDYVAVCRGTTSEEAESATGVAEGLTEVLQGRAARFVHEYPCHSPTQERWFALAAAPISEVAPGPEDPPESVPGAAPGPVPGAVVVHFDITERRHAEAEARRSQALAAHAARVNAVGVLAASLVHEITQPLTAASFLSATGTALLAQDGATDPWSGVDPTRIAQVLSGVDAQIQRAAAILERLRAFLREREIRPRPVPAALMVQQALKLLRGFAADKGVRLSLDCDLPEARVVADPLQIEQVLVNLVSNGIQAIDAAGTSKREVRVSLHPGPREVRVTVSDSGPGLPKPLDDTHFDLLAGHDGARLGLGLAVSRDIVESHGGRLWAEDGSDGGAVLHFTLPRDTSAREEPAADS